MAARNACDCRGGDCGITPSNIKITETMAETMTVWLAVPGQTELRQETVEGGVVELLMHLAQYIRDVEQATNIYLTCPGESEQIAVVGNLRQDEKQDDVNEHSEVFSGPVAVFSGVLNKADKLVGHIKKGSVMFALTAVAMSTDIAAGRHEVWMYGANATATPTVKSISTQRPFLEQCCELLGITNAQKVGIYYGKHAEDETPFLVVGRTQTQTGVALNEWVSKMYGPVIVTGGERKTESDDDDDNEANAVFMLEDCAFDKLHSFMEWSKTHPPNICI